MISSEQLGNNIDKANQSKADNYQVIVNTDIIGFSDPISDSDKKKNA